jgi:hypothetical protein
MFKPQGMVKNRSKCGTSHFLQVAGFVATFEVATLFRSTLR